MTLPIRPDLTFGSTPALPGALTGRLPSGGPPPAPYTPEGWEEERKRRLREAIAMGLPIRDVREIDGELKPTQLPAVTIEAPRPALPQLANVLARETYPKLEGTTSVPTSPLERYSVGGVLADVAAQPIAALMSTSGRIGEGVQRTLGFEEAARRTKERTQALNEALAPTTGLGVAARVPAELLTSAAPYVAAGPGAAGLLRSAALTGIESRAEEGSTVKALADLTESETLRRIAQSPYKTAADIGLDLALNAAPEVIGGALRGTRTAARAAEPGFLPAASAVARQVGQNIADVRPGAAVRALGTAVRQDPISALTAAATLGGEAIAPGLGTLAAALPATPRLPGRGALPTLPQEVRSVARFGFVRLPENAVLNDALEQDHIQRVMQATDEVLSPVTPRVTERAVGAGYFKGAQSPNLQLHFEPDATDDAIRRTAAIRGLAYGQDAQAWFREAKPTDTQNRFAGWRIHDLNEQPIQPEALSEVMERLSAPDMFGGDAGATIDKNGHLIVMNFSDMPTEEFNARMQGILRDVSTRHNISAGIGDFYSEYLDGPTAYLQALGQDTDALIRARDALVAAGPEYERYASAMGADLAETADRLTATRNLIEGRLDAITRESGPLGQMQRQLAGVPEEGVEVAAQRGQQDTATRLKQMKDRSPVDLSTGTPVQRALRVARLGLDDVRQAVRQFGRDASEWYSKQGQQASAQMQTLEPRLRGAPEKRFIANVILALTSSGATVEDNLARAMPIIRQWLDTGEITQLDVARGVTAAGETADPTTGRRMRSGTWLENLKGSTRAAAIEPGLRKLQLFLDANGGDVKAVRDFFRQTYKTKVGDIPTSADVFGPKVGRFLMNVEGAGGEVTVDSWALRTWMRWMGYGDEARMTFDKDAITPENPQGLVLRGGPTPEENTEIRQAFTKLADQISKETGQNFAPADVQALLWYWEKFNYGKWGSKSDLESFADVGNRFVMAGREPMPQMSNVAGQPYAFKFGAGPVTSGLERKATREYLTARGAPLRVYDIGGATGEALRQIVQRPALATGVGAAVGAAQSPEDRLGGAAVGALAGAGIAGAAVSGKQLLRARRALIEAGLPTELDRAYALAKGSIDFTGQVGRQIARRGREGFKRAFEKAIDGLAEIDRLSARAEARGMAPERSAATGLNMALSSQATAARALREGVGLEQGGIIDPETLEIVAPSLERVFQSLGNSPLKNEQGMTYAVAIRRLGRYDRAFADGAGNPLQVYGGDEAMLEADRAIVEAFGQKPEFVEFADGLRQYTDGLANYAVKTGLWTPEMAQRFKDSDALYVPFKRLIEANTAKPRMGMRGRPMPGQVTPGVQRFKGSDLMIGNPAEALAEYTASLIRRADAYRVGTMLMDTVEALGEDGAGILTKIDATDARVKAAAVANAEAAYRGMGLPEDEAEALADVFARLSTKNEVIWRNTPNGKEYFLVNDPALLNALSTLNVQDEGAVKAIVAVFGPLKRLATAFATGYAPAFWLGTNLPRDVQMGLLQTSGIRPGDVAGGMAEALKSIFGRSAEVEALGRAGAGQVSQYGGTLSPAAVARQIAPTTGGEQALGTLQQYIGAPLAAMERVGRASELPMRLAAARAARRQAAETGATEAGQRALAARQFAQATVDFRRRSGYALDRMFEQTVPYYGAAKKGLGMFLRTAARNPKRVGAAVGLVGLAVALEDVLLGEGQERAEALDRPSYERAKYLRVGNTKVALPQELAVFASAFRVGLAQLRQDDPYVYEQFKQSLENLLPPVVGDVTRGRYLPFPVLGQLEEIAQNRSVFTGRPIVPQGMERRMPSERRYETTAPTFDVLAGAARALGAEEASPLQAEYLVRGLTGRFTPAITAVTDIPAQAMLGEESRRQVPQPFMRQPLNPFAAFRVQPTRATESEREYYDLRSAYQQARATVTAIDRQYEQAQAAGDEDAMRRLEARSVELQRNPLFAQASRDVAAGAGASDVLNWDKQVQDRMDDIQADIDYVESEYAAKRMTGERARKLIDEYNTERRSLMREAAAGLRSRMGTPR